jgi:hypothetical protein
MVRTQGAAKERSGVSEASGNRIIDFDSTFFQGVDSSKDPSQLPLGYAWNAINMLNIGGTLTCRPGHRCVSLLPDGNLQGLALFRPVAAFEQLIVVIDGRAYVADYPFKTFRRLPNIQLSTFAKQVFFAQTVQGAERTSTDFSSPIKVISPKNVLFIQDGQNTSPAFYDGASNGHVRGDAFGTPSGGPITWVGDRLWVADGNQVFASDISNPFSFREQIYLGGVASFFFSDEVTAMVKTPSVASPQLMVFTSSDASILQANIRDRAQWPTTQNFQTEVVQVGCLSNRSALSHYGQIVWFSQSGVVIFDPATSDRLTARLPVRDNEQMVSKTNLDSDLSLVCASAFGQWLLMSVPQGDNFNRDTWVLNHASLVSLNDESGPSWSGQWIGTRPVEWVSGEIAGAERIYHISVDYDGKNRLWESFRPDRLDNNCPISWLLETRGYFGQTSPQPGKPAGARCRLAWVDIALAAIAEDVDLACYYAGGTRGAFRQILDRRLNVSKGSVNSELLIDQDTEIFSFKPQSRVVRTQDANQLPADDPDGGCGVERPDLDNIDESFQFAIAGHGPATIRWIRAFAFTIPEDVSGNSVACEDETDIRVVRFDGVGLKGTNLEELTQQLANAPLYYFTSNQTAQITSGDFTTIGVGFAQSVISQRAADRVAKQIALQQAEIELAADLPPIISTGFGIV